MPVPTWRLAALAVLWALVAAGPGVWWWWVVANGVLLVVAVVVEVLFRDLRRLRARVRALEKRNGPAGR